MTTLKNRDAKDLRISLLRITATLAIVWLHTNGTTVVHPEIIEVDEAHARWFVVNYYLMRWGVPIFLMITGALMLNRKKELTPDECIFKYARRIFFAVLLFGSAYSFVLGAGSDTIIGSLLKAPWHAVSGRTAAHLWYCFMLIGVYLIHPIFIQGFYRILKFTPMHMGAYRLGTVLIFLIVSLLSFLACAVLRLIPPMRKYVL